MMCGGLVVMAPGSPLQVLCAVLIMLLHLLFVLKFAPYVKDSEDISAFVSALGLCLLSLGAYTMMLDLGEEQMKMIGVITTVLPLMCLVILLGIMFFVDCGVWKKITGTCTKKTFATQVHPVEKHGGRNTGGVESSNKRLKSELQELKSWSR